MEFCILYVYAKVSLEDNSANELALIRIVGV